MKKEEYSIAYELAGLEGWNTGRNDHKTITDQTSFHCLKLDGKIVATIGCIKYGKSYAHIGLYICRKEHRGKGYAYQLWKQAMKTIEGRNIGLDANMMQIQRFGEMSLIDQLI